MDVTPPGAAGRASRPSRNTPSGIPLVLRRLAVGLAGAALAMLAAAACALSFEDLRALAVSGRAEPRLAYLYPAAFDILLVVALVSVPVLRGARLLVRVQAGFVLLVLLASAAAANASAAMGVSFDPEDAALVVALLPWVMLTVGLWLLLLLLKHVRTNRADLDLDGDSDEGLLPFDGEPMSRRAPLPAATAPYPAIPYPAVREERHAPPHPPGEEHAASLQPAPEAVAPPGYVPPLPVSPVSETVAPPEYAPPLPAIAPADDETTGPHAAEPGAVTPDAVTPDTDEDGVRLPPEAVPGETVPEAAEDRDDPDPEALAVVPPTAAPPTPPVTELPVEEPAEEVVEQSTAQIDTGMTEPARNASSDETAEAAAPAPEPVIDETPEKLDPAVTGSAETPAGPEGPQSSADPGLAEQTAPPRRNRPVRWGDLVRPHTGDVLVHPRPKPAEETPEPDGVTDDPQADDAHVDDVQDEAGIDTQPLRTIRDVPDPAHAADCAEPDEQAARHDQYVAEGGEQSSQETAQDGGDSVPLAPPSGRMRSTPRPPA
ncbi:DUF2637 domain-containing protein [Microbispora cellulosiformans]|uniref:DUF2637 domain-containing protein n=1 Tax=Microbispora cellulosiformans TaxID=2614688 RepID=A0A5J5KDB6_9ACTN|nr:DUF2637 domain-containing protein [Microbispora cellulosiformans]KAA9381914.1 DUF2637 domain-containing protein [Microbispora cellulosiformans]